MAQFAVQYLPIIIFLGIAAALGVGFILAAWVLAPKDPDKEKLSAYECGFNAFDDARMKFDVRFYLVSILFIIFDLEVAFLFPWAAVLGDAADAHRAGEAASAAFPLPDPFFLFWSMMTFLGVLTVGFIYEWRKGALEWE
jgi:NADH-quinone oxidoreductase subunit A